MGGPASRAGPDRIRPDFKGTAPCRFFTHLMQFTSPQKKAMAWAAMLVGGVLLLLQGIVWTIRDAHLVMTGREFK